MKPNDLPRPLTAYSVFVKLIVAAHRGAPTLEQTIHAHSLAMRVAAKLTPGQIENATNEALNILFPDQN